MKPFFSDKLQSKNKIVLIEDETIISKDVEVAETMNEFFRLCNGFPWYK